MSENKIKRFLKKHWGNLVLYGLLAILLFSTTAKTWLLQQVVSTGLFQPAIKSEKINAVSAPFSYTDESGTITSTAELKGKVVFINFWASWCAPCRAEMPSLQQLYHHFKNDDRVVFLFMNEDDDKSKAAKFLADKKYDWPLLSATSAVPGELFDGTLPTTVVLDKEGKMVMKHTGIARYDSENFIRQLSKLMEAPK